MPAKPKGEEGSFTDNEAAIMKAVWALGSGSVSEILEQVRPAKEMEFGTVQTYLRRLQDKGVLQSTLRGRKRVYSPRTRQKRMIQAMVDHFVRRLFDGNALPLMKHVVEARTFSKKEIAELRDLIAKAERREKE